MSAVKYGQDIIKRINKTVNPERMQKLPLNMELLKTCTADTVFCEKAEELLKQGAEPLGYVVDDDGWPDNVYNQIIWPRMYGSTVSETNYRITALFLRYGMDISKPAVPYDIDWVLNPMTAFLGMKDDWMLKTIRLLLDHGLTSDNAWEAWGHQIEDFVNVDGNLANKDKYDEYLDYIRMLLLFASYPHVLGDSDGLQREIWYKYNRGRYSLGRFRDWDWYDIEIDCSRCKRHPEVSRSVVTIKDKQTGEQVWVMGVDLTPEEAFQSTVSK